ncbi:MAG: hypothetical protein AAB288_10515 [Acidobacteriota bacterium]
MARTPKKQRKKKGVFETIRKPTAPPSQRMGTDKRPDKVDPAHRRVKHKKPADEESDV